MKRLYFVFALSCLWITAMGQSKKIVLMDIVDREFQIPNNTKIMIRSYVAEAITQTAGYETVDLIGSDDIIDGYEFRRTGNLNVEDIRKIGTLSNAHQILVVELSQPKSHQLFMVAKLYNISSTTVEKNANLMIRDKESSLQSGVKDLIDKLLWAPAEVKEEPSAALVIQESVVESANEKPSVEDPAGNRSLLERISRDAYKLGKQWYAREEYYDFINNRDLCLPAYQQFQQGLKHEKYGKWSGIAGAGVLLAGTLTMAIGVPTADDGYKEKKCYIAGGVLMGVGGAAAISGLSMWAIGIKKKNNAYKAYNEHCAESLSLNVMYKGNGLGLALQF